MNCEEFEAIGLGLEREGASANGLEGTERAGAMEHASRCPRCAALQESWQEARLSLQALGETTQQAEAPARVEMRLRQEFRTRHQTLKLRRRLIFGAWALATAALLLASVSWRNWRVAQNGARNDTAAVQSETPGVKGVNDSQDTLLADNEGDFTMLPGTLPQETQDAAVFRVRLQRGALADFGLPVNEERAADWIQVDLLVGEDGLPRAVRLPAGSSD